jgi:hypothetical protein
MGENQSGLAYRQDDALGHDPQRSAEGGHAMSLKWSEIQQIAAAIAEAPDEKLIQIVKVIDRLPDRAFLDEAVGRVRDRLCVLRPPRPLSMARILFEPVEDLLEAPSEYHRGSRRFNRGIIRTVVQIVEMGLGEERCATLKKEFEGRTTANHGFFKVFGARLWPIAADLLERTVKAAAADDKVRIARMGRDDDVLRQISELVGYLKLAVVIERLKADLPPKPFLQLEPHHIQALEICFAELVDPEQITLCTRVLLARSARPAELLEVVERIRMVLNQRQREVLVGHMAQSVLDRLGQDATRLSDFSAMDVTMAADLADQLTSSIDVLERKKQWGTVTLEGPALDRARREVANFVTGHLDRALEASEASTPHGTAVAALSDQESFAREERTAALRQFRDLSRILKIEHKVKSQYERIVRAMDHKAVEEVSTALRNGLPREDIDQIVADRLRLCDILEGYERAVALRDRLTALINGSAR